MDDVPDTPPSAQRKTGTLSLPKASGVSVGLTERFFYAGPKAPNRGSANLLRYLQEIAKDGFVEVTQSTLGRALGVNRNTIGRYVNALVEAGCIARERNFGEAHNRDADRLRIPVMEESDPRHPTQCAKFEHEVRAAGYGIVRKSGRGRSRRSSNIEQEFNFYEDKITKRVPLPNGFPDETARAYAIAAYAGAGLPLDIEKIIHGFRSRNDGDEQADWHDWWEEYVDRGLRWAVERAERKARQEDQARLRAIRNHRRRNDSAEVERPDRSPRLQ